MTYTLIDSEVLASSATSVTFDSLDTLAADYRDLIIVVEGLGTVSSQPLEIRFNGTSTNYNYVRMLGNGSSASSLSASSVDSIFFAQIKDTARGFGIVQIFDFSQTDKHKSVLTRSNLAVLNVQAHAGRWADTSAITSVTILSSSLIAATSTFYLYGIAA
jgi:hypothetical protein